MIRKIFICFLGLTFISFTLIGSNNRNEKTKIALGLTGGLSQYNTLSGEIYCGGIIPINSNNFEINIGYNQFNGKTNYKKISPLGYNAHGAFVEGNIILPSNIYLGLKLNYNLNWIDDNSQKIFDKTINVESPEFFAGKSGFSHVGYRLPLSNKFLMKFQGQIGFHNFKIAEGSYWQIGSGSNHPSQEAKAGIETKLHLLYNLNVGLNYKLNQCKYINHHHLNDYYKKTII
jgi:hypothetical protein